MLESLKNNLFTYEKLSEEEQQKRGILGRLIGIIADSKNPTRNGRLYTEALWENVFNDPVMKEKIENRCCFGELGHPIDREEVDPEKIAICLAEQPKLNDKGQLYGVFDILSTPCGKILKTLCDYGCKIGVSSRGSGDVDSNDEVDPETYYCECWDAVLVPAVKTARMQYVTESLNKNTKSLRKALQEDYENAKDEDKKVMKEAIDNLDLFEEEKISEEEIDDIPESQIDDEIEVTDDLLIEDADGNNKTNEDADVEADAVVNSTEEEAIAKTNNEENKEDNIKTVETFIAQFNEYDPKTEIEFAPINVEDKIYNVESIDLKDNDSKILITLNYEQEIADKIDDKVETEDEEIELFSDEDETLETEEVEKNEEVITKENETENTEDEAEDNGAKEVLESLKATLSKNRVLENQITAFENKQAASDARVHELEESVNRYKSAFERLSGLANKAKKSAKEMNDQYNSLKEQLNQKEANIASLLEKYNKAIAETQKAKNNNTEVKSLTESVNKYKTLVEQKDKQINALVAKCNEKLTESSKLVNTYKAKCNEAVDKYINYRASMLGVRPSEIKGRLTESYNMNDVDAICDSILSKGSQRNYSINNGISKSAKVKIVESKNNQIDPDNGYQIDDSLLDFLKD